MIIAIGLGIFFFSKKFSNTSDSVITKTITMEEVGKHTDQNSCWKVIDNNVYDVTSFITEHPGGAAILAGCGKDASILFNGRPNDGTSHSSRARSMLSSLQIGVLR